MKRVNEGAGEEEFYKNFKNVDWKGGEKFFPEFFGFEDNEDGHYMVMENLLYGMVHIPKLAANLLNI